MTDTRPRERPSLRLPIECAGGLEDPEVVGGLRAGGMRLLGRQEARTVELFEWRSVEARFDASLTLVRDYEVDDLACAFFSGPDRVGLAMHLVRYLRYIPTSLLHLAVREDADSDVRAAALQVLTQVYLAEAGVSYWDAAAEETARRVLEGPESGGELRRRALLFEVMGHPSLALQHIQELLAKEDEVGERQRLEVLRTTAEARAAEPAPVPVGPRATPGPELRLALPMVLNDSFEAVLARFDSVCTRVGRTELRLGAGVGGRVVELAANGFDARMMWAVSEGSSVGCAYFVGPDALIFAHGASRALCYLPSELAREVLRTHQPAESRVLALHALGFSASTQILPGKGVDPELRVLLQESLADPDPRVRGTALNMSLFLHEELSHAG